jgi:hypothetical protein
MTHITIEKEKLEHVGYITQARCFVHLHECTEAEAKLYGWKTIYTTPPAAQSAPVQTADIAALVEGMEVSIDVSTGDHDSGNRLFGTVTLAQENQGSKHGLILLVQEPEANFKTTTPPAAQPAMQEPVAWRVKVETKLRDGSVDSGYQLRNERLSAYDEPLYTTPPAAQPAPVADFDDPLVQTVYNILCDADEGKPREDHWEGWKARRIVAALTTPQTQPAVPLTEKELRRIHHEDQFGLFCDFDEFEQIVRATEQAHGITEKGQP